MGRKAKEGGNYNFHMLLLRIYLVYLYKQEYFVTIVHKLKRISVIHSIHNVYIP